MKRNTILIFISIFFALNLKAQEKQHEISNKTPFIEVVGTGEMIVSPDTLTLSICIREREEEKKSLAQLEKELKKELKQLGIKKEELQVADIGGVWRETGSKERKMEYFLTKTFRLKLGSVEQVDKLLANISRKNIDYIQISSLSNKMLKEYLQQTRGRALDAAKEKAEFLLKSQGKELGDIIFIIEQDNNERYPFNAPQSNIMLAYGNREGGSLENFRKINLRYSIKVRFEIK